MSLSEELSGESKVYVRCALQSFDDKLVICPHDWTVLRLKQHLRDVCDDKPDPTRQRLIFGGKCLSDASRLGGIFGKLPDAEHRVVHLVYTPTAEQIRCQRLAAARDTAEPQLRQRTSQPASTQAQAQQASPAPVAAAASGQPTANYDAARVAQYYQQLHMHHYNAYMAGYVNYMNQMYGASTGAAMGGGVMGGLGGAASMVAPVAVAAAAAQPAPINPQNDQPPPMNAQGGPDDQDGEGELRERDWLDWVYMACRASLLLTILYFYSSLERFAFVLACCLLLYVAQAGWFRRPRQQARQPVPVVVAPEPNNNQQEEVPPDNGQQPQNQQAQATDEGSVATQPSAWTVFWSTCYTFVTTFFASLIPEQPPPINLN